jgi:eukaryotic-like serine/threonine-protein kinase
MTERTVFLGALDRKVPCERADYLDAACAGDAALRARVEALLRSNAEAGDFLEVPAPEQLASGEDEPRPAGPPRPRDP